MLSLSPAVKRWYCPDPVDMCLGFDGLFALVRNHLHADPLSGHLFIFRNRTADPSKCSTGAPTACACGANAWSKVAITSPTLSMDAPLPDDVATLQAMVRDLLTEVARLRAENAELRGKLDAALKHRFGRRSERQLVSDAKQNKPGQQQAGPVLAALKQWLDEQKGKVLPKSVLGQAVGYALNNWAALARYQEQGYLAIDNNLSEQTLRAIAIGRHNWVVLGSERGGQTAAVLSSMVGTCKHLGMDPFAYLREALSGLFALGDQPASEALQEWLPDQWLLRRGRASPNQPAFAG